MRILFVYSALLALGLSMLVLMDVISGMALKTAFGILARSFSVTSTAENAILIAALFIPLLSSLIKRYKPKRKS